MKLIMLQLSMLFAVNCTAVTIDEMRDELIEQDVKFYYIVLAQSIEECGWTYGSYNATVRNNYYGLWCSETQSYFKFDNWKLSITGYKNMIQYRYRKGEGYYNFLKRIHYASNPLYITNLKSIVKTLKERYE